MREITGAVIGNLTPSISPFDEPLAELYSSTALQPSTAIQLYILYTLYNPLHTESLQPMLTGVVTTKMVVTTQGGVVTTLARGL